MNKKHILIIDDITLNLKYAEDLLKEKYQLSKAGSGRQALDMLKEIHPDLILLDVIMPEMDGYETFEQIRRLPEMKETPIIFLTADTEVGSELRGFKMGAMDYIHKPFEPDIMLSRIQRVLEVDETKRKLEVHARKDVLTGLWNRSYLQEIVAKAGEAGEQGIFVLFDMDNFKNVNDTFGHLVGDTVLVRFAETLKEKMGAKDVACRLGGDEFAVFLRSADDREAFARRISKWLEEMEMAVREIKGEETGITVSAGVSGMPTDGVDFVSLYNKADKALYHVKQNGKRDFHFYQDKENFVFENSSAQAELQDIQELITDKQGYKGAFQMEYEGFRKIYQFIERCVERSSQEVSMVLFSVRACSGREQDVESNGRLIRLLEDTIVYSLRKGDVANRYNNSQYVVLLMDASPEASVKVAERVIGKCAEQFMQCGYEIFYDIQKIKKRTAE